MNLIKLKRYTRPSLLKCTWDKEGEEILSGAQQTNYLSINEKEKIKFLLSLSIPDNKTRKKVILKNVKP
jgi:hypothetical protein